MSRPAPAKASPLGRRLREARLGAGFPTARAAARAIGMSEAQYAAVEAGNDARYSTLARIVAGLGIDPRPLFPGEDR